jgi:hypothetical protein
MPQPKLNGSALVDLLRPEVTEDLHQLIRQTDGPASRT